MGNYPYYVKAIFYVIIMFAVTHLALSLFYGIMNGHVQAINMFHILGVDLFWPELGTGRFNAVLGAVVVAVAWLVVAFTLRWRDLRADELRKAEKSKKK